MPVEPSANQNKIKVLQKRSAWLYIQGVPARGGRGSTDVAQFLAKQLWLPKPLYRWQKRKGTYLLKQCGHRSKEEGAVCETPKVPSQTGSCINGIFDDHQPLALAAASNHQPLALAAASSAAILEDESAILCAESAILTSEHSTVQSAPSVTSSGRGYIRRFTPEPGSMRELLSQCPGLPDPRRSQHQQHSGIPRLSPVEKEAIRWKGKPWLAPSPVRPLGLCGTSFGPHIVG